MRNPKKIVQSVRQKKGKPLGFSSGGFYENLSAESETALLFDIAKAMNLTVSQEEIRAAVDHFKKKEHT